MLTDAFAPPSSGSRVARTASRVATETTTTKTNQADRKPRNQRARETGADTKEADGSTGTIPEDVAWFWQRAHAWG